jgi:site-specific DNA-methyltransferase (adenine-specific)
MLNFDNGNSFELYNGDCLEIMRSMPDNSIDSIVTDPPYGLSFMGKKWDYDVPSVAIWAECLRVLKPGGTMKKLMDVSRIHSLGWKHEISLEEGLKRSINFYLKTLQ